MIKITENLYLKEITNSDTTFLFLLMQEVYPLAYSHFWNDKGDWYINSQYTKENILKELSQENADYYFVVYNDEIIGNFRIIWDEKLKGLHYKKQVKLHRVYLHKKVQGKGIGKQLISWLTEIAIKKEYEIIWLDAMNQKTQAFDFYQNLGYQYFSHWFLPYKNLKEGYSKMSQLYKKLI